MSIDRPLAVLTEMKRAIWDVVVVDGSTLGRAAVVVLGGVDDAPIISSAWASRTCGWAASCPCPSPRRR